MKIRGKTMREKMLRRRVLHSLQGIRAEEKKGRSPREATISAMEKAQRERFGIKGKPFLEMQEERAMKKIDRAFSQGLEQRQGEESLRSRERLLTGKNITQNASLLETFLAERAGLGLSW